MKDDLIKRRVKQLPLVKYSFDLPELSLYPIGDAHYGSPEFDKKRFLDAISFIKDTPCKVILMGDMLENASRYSVGAGWAEQKITPQEQLDDLYTMLYPIRDKVLVSLEGNHCERAYKHSGIDLAGTLAKLLGVPYGGYASFIYIRLQKQSYVIHAQHGCSSAQTTEGRINAAKKTALHTDADVYLYAHTHDLADGDKILRFYDRKSKVIKKRKQHFVLTGSFLGFGGYGEKKNYGTVPVGFPTITFGGVKRKINVSFQGK